MVKIVELCGMVSCGKSTFFNEQVGRDPAFRSVAELMPYRTMQESLLKNVLLELTFLALFPSILVRKFPFFFEALFKDGIRVKKVNFLRSYIRKVGVYKYLQRFSAVEDDRTVYLFDEGFFQLIVNSVDVLDNFSIEDHLDKAVNWHSVIFFTNDPDTLLERTMSRPDLSYRYKDASRIELHRVFQKTLDRIEAFLNAQPDGQVFAGNQLDIRSGSLDSIRGKILHFGGQAA